uniref:Putative secreted protein n=1 Tax=Anopheles darlingi TaxID=43151 RepID=A0A2M4DA95_ANODA
MLVLPTSVLSNLTRTFATTVMFCDAFSLCTLHVYTPASVSSARLMMNFRSAGIRLKRPFSDSISLTFLPSFDQLNSKPSCVTLHPSVNGFAISKNFSLLEASS